MRAAHPESGLMPADLPAGTPGLAEPLTSPRTLDIAAAGRAVPGQLTAPGVPPGSETAAIGIAQVCPLAGQARRRVRGQGRGVSLGPGGDAVGVMNWRRARAAASGKIQPISGRPRRRWPSAPAGPGCRNFGPLRVTDRRVHPGGAGRAATGRPRAAQLNARSRVWLLRSVPS